MAGQQQHFRYTSQPQPDQRFGGRGPQQGAAGVAHRRALVGPTLAGVAGWSRCRGRRSRAGSAYPSVVVAPWPGASTGKGRQALVSPISQKPPRAGFAHPRFRARPFRRRRRALAWLTGGGTRSRAVRMYAQVVARGARINSDGCLSRGRALVGPTGAAVARWPLPSGCDGRACS